MGTHKGFVRTLAGAGVGAGAVGAAIAGVRSVTARRGPTNRQWENPLLRDSLDYEVIPVITEDGATLRVHAYGPADGDPIVLSHGWTCCIEYWNPQINVLAEKFRVIAYDQRGHGHSDFGSRKPSPDVLADDLASVLSASIAPGKKAVLVGHSMGGMSIMAWAGRHPKQVAQYAGGVVLANTGSDSLIAQTTIIPLLPERVAAVKNVLGRAVLAAPIPLPAGAATRRPFQFAVMAPGSTRESIDFCQRIALSCKGSTRGKWGLALADLDISAALHNLNVPTVVIAGELDRLTPPAHSVKLAEALDRNGILDRLVVIPAVGHMGNVEAIEEFNAEIVRLRLKAKRGRRKFIAVAG